jgi:ankyrin repeat protein
VVHTAALLNDASVLAVLLNHKGVQVDVRDRQGTSALHLAASANQVQAVLQLLDKEANPRLTDLRGRTPLHEFSRSDDISGYGISCLHDATLPVLKQLLTQGASLDDRDNDKFTPLQLAIRNKRQYKSKSLLKCGAQLVSAMDPEKNVWLLQNLVCDAYLAGQLEIFRHIASVYEITRPYRLGWLHRALKDRERELWDEIAQLMPKEELERVTLSYLSGLRFTSSDSDGEIAFLLEHSELSGHQLDSIGAVKNGQTLLSNAAEQGRRTDVRELLRCGVSTEIPDAKGRTALWFAVRQGKVDCTTFLLESGADPRVRDTDSNDILQVAKLYHRGKEDLASLIRCKLEQLGSEKQNN